MQEIGEALRQRLGEGVAGGARQAVELGGFHCLSGGDAPEGPPCHGIPGHPSTDLEALGRLGGRAIRNARGGHIEVMHTVHHRRPPGRNRGAQG